MDVNVLLNDHESFHEYPPESKTIRFSDHDASPDGLPIASLSCLGAFGYLNDMLYQSNIQYQSLSNTITALPMKTPHQGLKDLKNEYNGPFCHDGDLLLLKATSKLVLDCMQNTVVLLRDIKETQSDNQFQNRTYEYHQKSPFHRCNSILKEFIIRKLLSPMAMLYTMRRVKC